ncbi:MAG: hypothetical protein FD167_3167, partial [bacterium]
QTFQKLDFDHQLLVFPPPESQNKSHLMAA